jgi:hypothetical protein
MPGASEVENICAPRGWLGERPKWPGGVTVASSDVRVSFYLQDAVHRIPTFLPVTHNHYRVMYQYIKWQCELRSFDCKSRAKAVGGWR